MDDVDEAIWCGVNSQRHEAAELLARQRRVGVPIVRVGMDRHTFAIQPQHEAPRLFAIAAVLKQRRRPQDRGGRAAVQRAGGFYIQSRLNSDLAGPLEQEISRRTRSGGCLLRESVVHRQLWYLVNLEAARAKPQA